uniref:SH3 domain-containing protein n=1 Tax=Schistosoma curassoni TaxID=6186 RepID=A0A183JE10_9TREM
LPPPPPPTSTDQLQEQQQIPKTCNAPPVINSLKPRNQTAISQIAQMLQEKGIVSYRSRQMPSGAKHLYPGSHPLLISSAPSSSERLKSFTQMNNIHDNNNNNTRNCTDNNNLNVNTKIQDETTNNTNNEKRKEEEEGEQTLVKTTKYHSPLLVETVLSKLLPELNRSPSRSSDLNNSNKTSNNKHTLNPRMNNSKRLDTDKNHSIETSYSTDNKNDTVMNTTNNNISNGLNYLKHLNESNMHNGIETDHGDQSTDVKSITIVKNAKLFRNNSSATSKNNIDYNSHLRRAYTVIKPPEKLITSKAYISLSSSGKSSNNNQVSKTMTEEPTTNIRYDQQSPRSESNYQYSLMDSTGESNHSKLITTNDWLIVEHEQLGNESTGELHLTVGDILKCIDSSPQVCDRRSDSHLQYSISSSSSSRKWIKCENWFGVIGLVNISSVRVIDNSNELAYYLEARPRVKALYTFDKETDEDLALSPGEIVYLFEAIDENWYRGESATTGDRGMFPATFVEVIKPL